jgi:septal ring factor EnvC (AmiA/AmiB activator)
VPEDDVVPFAEQIRQAREQLEEKFRLQAEHLQNLERVLKDLRDWHEQLRSEVRHRFEALGKSRSSSTATSESAGEVQKAEGALAAAAGAAFDPSQLGEAELKMHKDARRFAHLLVDEIELYNKAKVAEGRENKDLYKRMKHDIDRSRHTFEQRFGKSVGRQFDYFHDELVKTLAGNDPSLLGSDYPGPSV